jgi:signal transduction histidine kinase
MAWFGRLRGNFLVRVALVPVVVTGLLGTLFAFGSSTLHTQQAAMTAVVEMDLESSARLADINSRLQTANTDMYRLITEAAAGGPAGAFPSKVDDLSRRVEGIIVDLKDYRDGEAGRALKGRLDTFIDDLDLFKGAIDFMGSMLEIDFKTAIAFVTPYNSHVDRLSQQLSAIISDSTITAKARAEVAAGALRQVAYSYVIAAAAVSILVALFGYVMGKRQEFLYKAARVKTKQVETLLDNSGQGFLSVGPDLTVAEGYSRACEQMFDGRVPAGCPVDELLYPAEGDADARSLLRTVVGKTLAEADPFRRGIILSLLPGEVELYGKTLEVECRPLDNGSLMLVLTDVTEARTLARQVERERQRLEMIVAAVSDGHDFFDAIEDFRRFFDRVDAVALSALPAAVVLVEVYRQVHTFKGVFNQFSFRHLPEALHTLETRLQHLRDADRPCSTADIRRVMAEAACLDRLEADLLSIRTVLGDGFLEGRGTVSLSIHEAKRLEELALRLTLVMPEARELVERLTALRKIPLKAQLEDFSLLVQREAERCEKDVAPLVVEGDEVLLAPELAQPFLRVVGHIFRNAVDHGIEAPEMRLSSGKDEVGHISCSVVDLGASIRIEIADDGAGIDLAAVRRRVSERSGASVVLTDEDALDVIFSDGISTSDAVSELSGRGVGLAAVRTAVQEMGGWIKVSSEPGGGTRFIIQFPNRDGLSAEAA